MTTFADLNLHERLIKALGELEITTPTPVQASAIPEALAGHCLLYTSPSPRDATLSRMPSSA